MAKYMYRDKFGEEFTDSIRDETVYVDGELVSNGDSTVTIYLITLDESDVFLMHRYDGPAYVQISETNQYFFHRYGNNCVMQDMGVDEETQMLWILKYGNKVNDDHSDFYYYGDQM